MLSQKIEEEEEEEEEEEKKKKGLVKNLASNH